MERIETLHDGIDLAKRQQSGRGPLRVSIQRAVAQHDCCPLPVDCPRYFDQLRALSVDAKYICIELCRRSSSASGQKSRRARHRSRNERRENGQTHLSSGASGRSLAHRQLDVDESKCWLCSSFGGFKKADDSQQDGFVDGLPSKDWTPLQNGSTTLEFRANVSSEGEYTCHFENRLGADRRTFKLVVHYDDHSFVAVIIVLAIIAALIAFVARIFYVRFSVVHRYYSAE